MVSVGIKDRTDASLFETCGEVCGIVERHVASRRHIG
jgi:hypothetical protein